MYILKGNSFNGRYGISFPILISDITLIEMSKGTLYYERKSLAWQRKVWQSLSVECLEFVLSLGHNLNNGGRHLIYYTIIILLFMIFSLVTYKSVTSSISRNST